MSAICISQMSCRVVVFDKDQGRVCAFGGVAIEELIHRLQQMFRLVQSDSGLTAQISLKISHQ